MKKVAQLIIVLSLILSIGACKELFSEGDPVPAKEGIAAKWQANADPDKIITFNADGTGMYNSTGIDGPFKYSFKDDDTVKVSFPNGNSIEFDVRTTTLYMWMTDSEGNTDQLHKME